MAFLPCLRMAVLLETFGDSGLRLVQRTAIGSFMPGTPLTPVYRTACDTRCCRPSGEASPRSPIDTGGDCCDMVTRASVRASRRSDPDLGHAPVFGLVVSLSDSQAVAPRFDSHGWRFSWTLQDLSLHRRPFCQLPVLLVCLLDSGTDSLS